MTSEKKHVNHLESIISTMASGDKQALRMVKDSLAIAQAMMFDAFGTAEQSATVELSRLVDRALQCDSPEERVARSMERLAGIDGGASPGPLEGIAMALGLDDRLVPAFITELTRLADAAEGRS